MFTSIFASLKEIITNNQMFQTRLEKYETYKSKEIYYCLSPFLDTLVVEGREL